MAPRYSARTLVASASSSAAKVACRSCRKRLSAAASASRTAGECRGAADKGAPDLRGLLEEGGTVRDRPFDAGRQRQPGGELGHVRPLAPEQQGGHGLVEVVHVGEVVEDETERDTGPPGHGLRRRVGLAGAQQLHEGLRHVAAGSLPAGHPPVPGRLLQRDERSQVECVSAARSRWAAREPRRPSRLPASPAPAEEPPFTPFTFLSVGRIQREVETCEIRAVRPGPSGVAGAAGVAGVAEVAEVCGGGLLSQRTDNNQAGGGTTCPASSVTVSSQRAASWARCVMTRTLRPPAAVQHTPEHLVGQRGVEPAGGFVEHQDGPGRQQGAGHGQSSTLAAGHGDAVLAHRRLEALGERGHPVRSRWAAANASAISWSLASGRPRTRLDRTVPAKSCARWSASTQAARASAWRSAPRRCRRATRCRPRAARSAGAR